MSYISIRRNLPIFIAIALLSLFPGALAETCTGGLTGTGLNDNSGTAAAPDHDCAVDDMDFDIRAPDDVTSTGWVDMTYASETGTCSSTCTEEVWANNYGYTFCPQEGAYDIRTRAYADGDGFEWETSDWGIGLYTVNWDTSSDWCECKTGSASNYFATVSGGSNSSCCGDDTTNDDFYYYSANPTTATSLSCKRCSNGSVYGPTTLYGNGKWSGTNTTTDTTGTCYYENITCTDSTASHGTSSTLYGNGYWNGSSPTTDTTGTCYTGNISCADGLATSGSSNTYYGNGHTTDSPTADTSGLCYYGNITCSDGSASNGTTNTVYGNGYSQGTTCYYGDWTCADGSASNGATCTMVCSGIGSSCCPTQNTYRTTITCAEAGCGYTDYDRDVSQTYCLASTGGCIDYNWDSVGSRCCGDDGSGDNFCSTGGGSCINGSWTASHCTDSVKNCDETAIDCGGSSCSTCPSDSTAPTTTHDANEQWQTTNQTITLTCDDGSATGATGCANTYYCIDDTNTCNPSIIGTTVNISCAENDTNTVYIRYYSVDNASNETTVDGIRIRIDKQKPTTTATTPGSWQDSNSDVTLSCSDGLGSGCNTIYYRLDSNPSSVISYGSLQTYSSAITFSSDGNYSFKYYSKDNVDNTETANAALVLIDKGISSVESNRNYSIYSDYNGVIIIPIITDGNHRIDFNSTDYAGNNEQIRTNWASLDKVKPSTTDDANIGWQNENISLNLTCADATSGCYLTQYRIDSNNLAGISMGAWQTYSSTIPITVDGNYAIDYNSQDYAGLIETTNRVYAQLDKSAPTILHDAPTAWQNSNVLVTLTPEDGAGSGAANTYHCTDDTNACTPTSTGSLINVSCVSDSICQKYVRYYATDTAGNSGSISATNLIKIDKEYPTTTSDANTECQAGDQNIIFTPTDGSGSGLAGTFYCVDDSNSCNPDTNSTTINITCSTGQTCTRYLRYRSVDNADNNESLRVVIVTIDQGVPVTSNDANTQWQGSNQNITLTPSDGSGCGIAATYYCTDTTNSCTPAVSGTSVSITCTANDVNYAYLRFHSIDSVGNTEETKSVLIRIDRQPPTTTDDANADWVHENQTVNFTINDSSGAGGDSVYYCTDDANTCNPNLFSTTASVTCDSNAVCQKYLRYKGVDYVGNQSQTNGTLMKIDRNAPQSTSNAPVGWVLSDQSVSISVHETGSGLQFTKYCYDSDNSCTPATTYSSTIAFNCAADNVCISYLKYYSKDNAGNIEGTHSDPIRIDKQAPTTTDNAPDGWANSSVTVTLSPSDGSGSGISTTYYCADTTNSCTPTTSGTSANFDCDADSMCSYFIRYYSVDNAGNTETLKSADINIDRQGPATTDDAPEDWVSSNQTVTLTATDTTGSGIAATYYCVDTGNTCSPSTSGTSVNITCETGALCPKYLRYYSVDNMANEEGVNSTLVRIDKNPPTTTDNASTDWYGGSSVSITLTPSDGSGSGIANTYYCADDSNSCTPSATGTTPSVTCDSNSLCYKYVRYYSTDNAGNQETTKSTVQIRIDNNGPYTLADYNSAWQPDDTNVSLSCSSISSSCAQTTYRINSGTWTVYASEFTVTESGINTIDFNSRDTLGNSEPIKSIQVKIDRTAPSTSDDANTTWQSEDISFSIIPADSQSGVYSTHYCTDSTNSCTPTIAGTSVSVTCDANRNCSNYVRYYSVDNVGNTETTNSVLVRIDKRSPVCSANAPTGCVNVDFNVSLLCLDESGSGRHTIKYRFDSDEWLSSIELPTVTSNWVDSNWHRRRKITFNNSGESVKENYSILLRFNSSNFNFLETLSTGNDLRFYDDDHGTELQYFVDVWNRSARDGVVWVKVPQIDADSATDHVWMYYSNSNADSNQAANWHG